MTSAIAPPPARDWRRSTRRAFRRYRRPLVALSAAVTLGATLLTLRPPPPPTMSVLAAAHDIPGGAVLRARDLVVQRLPRDAVPAGASTRSAALVGRTLAAPVRAREVVTDARLLGRSLAGGTGRVLSVVRVAESATRSLVHVGDRVDVLAAVDDAPGGAAPATVVATGVRVVGLPGEGRASTDTASGTVLVVVTDLDQAQALAGASAGARLSVIVLG